MPKPEAALHRAVAQYLTLTLKRPWSTIPSGGGGRIRGAQLKAMGLQRGMPDIVIIGPGGRFLGIELKAAKGKVSEHQNIMFDQIIAFGGDVAVCRSIEEVKAAMTQWGIKETLFRTR